MTAAPQPAGPAEGWWPVADGDPFLGPGRLPEAADPDRLSRFGDSRWDLSPLHANRHQRFDSLNWERFPLPLRPSFRRAGWALVNLPTPGELLERPATNRVKWISPATMKGVARDWRQLASWLASRGITGLPEVTENDLEEFAHLIGTAVTRQRAAEKLEAVSLLWAFAPHLPPGDRLRVPPWETGGRKDYLPPPQAANENSTPPIHPAVMSPLLVWALRFVEDFADDILTAWAERQRLMGQVRAQANPEARPVLRRLLAEHAAQHRPLPGGVYLGRPVLARSYLAGLTNASTNQVERAVRDHGQDLPVGTETPLGTAIGGRLHGQPWKPHIDFHEAPVLMRRLATACMIVVLYLSGMRPGEGLELQVGCCPEPDGDGTGGTRYEIHGNVFKDARDHDGRQVVGGIPRATPWTVLPPVAHAIRVLERMADGPLLFPVKTPWAKPSSTGARKRTGEVLSCRGAGERIAAFTAWVNDFADQHGLAAERIPDDPDGPITVDRFRRSLAWHIARLPGGRIALALQYGHLRASAVTEGYSGRARQGLRRVLDIETARAMADYLDTVAEATRDGGGVSGPAAHRMLTTATQARTRFEGVFLTPKQAAALLAEPRFHVYDNPEAFLACNHDPAKALCHPERTRQSQRAIPPATDRCNPACANIARTDAHIAALRREIAHLTEEIGHPSTPTPLRERLHQRIASLQGIADRHDKTRVVFPEGGGDDR